MPHVQRQHILDPHLYWQLRHLISQREAHKLNLVLAQNQVGNASAEVRNFMARYNIDPTIDFTFVDSQHALTAIVFEPDPIPQGPPAPAPIPLDAQVAKDSPLRLVPEQAQEPPGPQAQTDV